MDAVIIGRLHRKRDTEQINEKFRRREIILELTQMINGNSYLNYAKIQLVQNKCEIVERFREGDMLKVYYNVKGNMHINKRTGKEECITNLDAWRIEKADNVTIEEPTT